MEWTIPIIAIAIGVIIVVLLLVPKRKSGGKTVEGKVPLCPGCSVENCPAKGKGNIDTEVIRQNLVERA